MTVLLFIAQLALNISNFYFVFADRFNVQNISPKIASYKHLIDSWIALWFIWNLFYNYMINIIITQTISYMKSKRCTRDAIYISKNKEYIYISSTGYKHWFSILNQWSMQMNRLSTVDRMNIENVAMDVVARLIGDCRPAN